MVQLASCCVWRPRRLRHSACVSDQALSAYNSVRARLRVLQVCLGAGQPLVQLTSCCIWRARGLNGNTRCITCSISPSASLCSLCCTPAQPPAALLLETPLSSCTSQHVTQLSCFYAWEAGRAGVLQACSQRCDTRHVCQGCCRASASIQVCALSLSLSAECSTWRTASWT